MAFHPADLLRSTKYKVQPDGKDNSAGHKPKCWTNWKSVQHRVSPRWAGRGPSPPAARPDSAGCSASGSCPLWPWSSLRGRGWWSPGAPSWWSPSGRPPGSSPGPGGLSPSAPPGCHPALESPGTSRDGFMISTYSRDSSDLDIC